MNTHSTAPLATSGIDAIDRQIIAVTQKGLPLIARPYDVLAEQLDLSARELKFRIDTMINNGVIRRIGVVPNHYRLGYAANGMSVWDVDDGAVDEMGELVGALDYVSHCYKRPRKLPIWRYNLFAMVHGKTREEVEEKVTAISSILLGVCSKHDIIYSTRILKKTGLRLHPSETEKCSD
jgi:DNA-binding Lrp family transcriptional regulator